LVRLTTGVNETLAGEVAPFQSFLKAVTALSSRSGSLD
jgi:hypothetical protein